MAKGSAHEREFCKKLSLWWSDGQDDFVFWRTDASGGRATSRARKGLKTNGRCGDLCAVDERGQPLIKLITFELKRGYNSVTPTDLIDCDKPCTNNKKAPRFGDFVKQTEEAAERAGTPYWMLVHRRDKRKEMVYMPMTLFRALDSAPSSTIGLLDSTKISTQQGVIIGIELVCLLEGVEPEHIRKLARKL